jgi:hypothetical protein
MPGQMMWGTTSMNFSPAPLPPGAQPTEQFSLAGLPGAHAPFGAFGAQGPRPPAPSARPGASFGEVWQAQQGGRKRLALDTAPRAKRRQVTVQEAANHLAVCSLGKRHRADIDMMDTECPVKAPRTSEEEMEQDEQYALVPFKPAIEYLRPKRQDAITSAYNLIDVSRFVSKPAPTAIVLWKPRPQDRVYEYDVDDDHGALYPRIEEVNSDGEAMSDDLEES